MNDTNNERLSVYEIGFLIAGSLPEESISAEWDALKGIVTDAGGSIIAEGAPARRRLAYEMRKKTVSGAYDKYAEAYFGWVKFEISPDKIVSVKNAFEAKPSVIRVLVTSTVRENTFLGRQASVIAASFSDKRDGGEASAPSVSPESVGDKPAKPAAPVSIEDVDKSIDEMVKGTDK